MSRIPDVGDDSRPSGSGSRPFGQRNSFRPNALLVEAIASSREVLLDAQSPGGYWVGELEGGTILEAEYLLMMAHLGLEADPVCLKLGQFLRDQAIPSGGWSIYPGGPLDVSASVESYCALKMIGTPADDPILARSRVAIRKAGGLRACNSFTRFNLALLGQVSYEECPEIPPELALLPRRLSFLNNVSSWTRTIVVPLSIISALKPTRSIPPERGIAELDVPPDPYQPAAQRSWGWTRMFLGLDRLLKGISRRVPRSWREPGLRAAEQWIRTHLKGSDGLGAIFPPMIYTVVALRALGYSADSAEVNWAMDRLADLMIDDGDTLRIQPCVSPVWDTAISMIALADARLPDFHPALLRGVRWLLDREVRTPGDWQAKRPGVEPGGWHFQFRNAFYPDVDDTAMVLLAIHRTALADDPAVLAATRRGVAWLLAMQNRDGGWAAFDADVDNEVWTRVPFADHNAMLDPSCADISARVLELLGQLGHAIDHPAVVRGLDYLWKTQEPEGCWYGRWGVNYIYGTWQVLLGLRAVGHPMDDPRARRAADWLESVQQGDGSWGESCRSYDDPSWMGQGESTASQTAWAVLGLIAAGRAFGDAVRRGIDFLTDTQQGDGTWEETAFTGTGFPRVFYLKYHLYRLTFPLMALTRYRAAIGKVQPGALASRVPASPRVGEV